MGVPLVFLLFLEMFIRQKKNKSGSVSVQLISKSSGKYKLVKTVGSSSDEQQIAILLEKAKQEIHKIKNQSSLFVLKKML